MTDATTPLNSAETRLPDHDVISPSAPSRSTQNLTQFAIAFQNILQQRATGMRATASARLWEGFEFDNVSIIPIRKKAITTTISAADGTSTPITSNTLPTLTAANTETTDDFKGSYEIKWSSRSTTTTPSEAMSNQPVSMEKTMRFESAEVSIQKKPTLTLDLNDSESIYAGLLFLSQRGFKNISLTGASAEQYPRLSAVFTEMKNAGLLSNEFKIEGIEVITSEKNLHETTDNTEKNIEEKKTVAKETSNDQSNVIVDALDLAIQTAKNDYEALDKPLKAAQNYPYPNITTNLMNAFKTAIKEADSPEKLNKIKGKLDSLSCNSLSGEKKPDSLKTLNRKEGLIRGQSRKELVSLIKKKAPDSTTSATSATSETSETSETEGDSSSVEQTSSRLKF